MPSCNKSTTTIDNTCCMYQHDCHSFNRRRTKAEIQAGCNSHLFDLTRIPETDPSLSLLAAQSVTFGELNLSSSGDGDGVGDGGSSNVDSSSRSSSSSSSSVSIDTPRSKPESELKLNERAAAVFQFLLTLPQTSIAMVVSVTSVFDLHGHAIVCRPLPFSLSLSPSLSRSFLPRWRAQSLTRALRRVRWP